MTMWTTEVVRDRFVEAAEIERRMRVKGMQSGSTAWPAYDFDAEDRKGWVQADIDAELEEWSRNKATTTPEMTRWEEAFFQWTPMIPERRRALVWGYAICMARNFSFSAWCQRHGMLRRTAYNRLEKVFSDLAHRFDVEGRLLRAAEHIETSQEPALTLHETHTVANCASSEAIKFSPGYRTEESTDLLTSPAALAEFSQHLSDVNEQRRKLRLRKTLRGVPGEVEAA